MTQLSLTPGSNTGVPQNLEAVRRAERARGRRRRGRARAERRRRRHGPPAARRTTAVQAAVSRLQVGPLDRPGGRARRLRAAGPQYVDPTHQYLHMQIAGKHEYGLPAARSSSTGCATSSFRRRLPGRWEVLAGGGPPVGVDFLDMTYDGVPVARAGRAPADLRAPRPRVPVAAAAAEGDRHEPARDRRRVRPARRLLQVRRGRAVRHPAVRPDRGLDPGLPVRDALRALDGLRGVPRLPDARGVGQAARQRLAA